jgi:hypothetical protein
VRLINYLEIILAILKYLVGIVLAASGMAPGESEEGWFPVEKVPKGAEPSEERDPSIWTLFSKSLGDEKFFIRFPDDPVYQYIDSETIEISSAKDGETFQLTVQPVGPADLEGELSYEAEGKWVTIHLVQSEGHFYRFKTVCNEAKSPQHEAFISSFFIEKT